MKATNTKLVGWGAVVLLVLASGWAFNIAAYNWFAADHHNEYSRAYAVRGNLFFLLSLILLALSLGGILKLARSRKNRDDN
jgi:hypothetical protein